MADYTKILIDKLELMASIGIHDHEKADKQRVIISAEIYSAPVLSDTIADTVDYEQVINEIRAHVQSRHFELAETLAEDIAKICLSQKGTQKAMVRVAKPDIIKETNYVGVEIFREQ